MVNPTYEAKILLKNSYSSQTVQVQAFNATQAKKAIEAMYGPNIKSWMYQPYIVIDQYGRKV